MNRAILPGFVTCFVLLVRLPIAQAENHVSGDAAKLYQKALKEGRFATQFEALGASVRQTSDVKSFYLVWKSDSRPKKWIVSLHGAGHPARGFATDDLAVWSPHLKERDVGIVCLQWWLGTGSERKDFYTPLEIYRQIDDALASLGVEPGNVMLHGFSRGAANTYAVAAIDASRGKRYFSLCVASSGGASMDYGPNQAIARGDFGSTPLKNTRWITVAGGKDSNPDRDGIAGMRRTANWLRDQGASVTVMEDEASGHGALHLRSENAKKVLDAFLNP